MQIKVEHVHMKLKTILMPMNYEVRSLVNAKSGEYFLTLEAPFNYLPCFQYP